MKATLHALMPMLQQTMPWVDFYPKPGPARGVQVDLNPERVSTERTPMRPQTAVAALNEAWPRMLSFRSIVARTHFAARTLMLKERQRLTGTGLLATMAPGLPYTIAAALAYPGR